MLAPFGPAHQDDPFGDWPQWRKNMGLGPHRGQDFNRLPEGTPIPASGTGRVVHIEWNNVLGHVVVVQYGNVYIGYCHMRDRTHLYLGNTVSAGDTVGLLGNSGSASTGAHLHMTASYYNGSPGTVRVVDPMQFFSGSVPAGGGTNPIGEDEMNDQDRQQFQILAATVNAMSAKVANIDAWVSEGGPGVDKGLAKPGTVASRVINLDRQLTGANGWKVNLVQHALDIKRKLGI